MVPRSFYDKFADYGIPEMLVSLLTFDLSQLTFDLQRSRIDQLVLMTKLINLGEPKAILALALSPPNLDDIERTIIALKEVSCLVSVVRLSQNISTQRLERLVHCAVERSIRMMES